MIKTNKSLSNEEISIIREMLGQKLVAIDAVIVARSNLSWNTVRLHFDGLDIDFNNRLGDLEVDEYGTIEEFGLMSVARADSSTLNVSEASASTTVMEIGKTVTGVRIVSDEIVVHGDGLPVAEIVYPQAIVLELEDGVIVLDKECWFSEMIAIKQGEDAESLIYDESVNWADDSEDPSTHYEFSTMIQKL